MKLSCHAPKEILQGVQLSCVIYNTVFLHEKGKRKAEDICFAFSVTRTDTSLFKTQFPCICFDNIDLGLL